MSVYDGMIAEISQRTRQVMIRLLLHRNDPSIAVIAPIMLVAGLALVTVCISTDNFKKEVDGIGRPARALLTIDQ